MSDETGGEKDSSYEMANTSSASAAKEVSSPLKPCSLFENIELAKKPEKKPKLDLVDIEFAKYLQRKNQEESSSSYQSENNDPDKSFLYSLLPYMKSMTEDEKLYFRIETMKFIRSMKHNVTQVQQQVPSQTQQQQGQVYYGHFDPQSYGY